MFRQKTDMAGIFTSQCGWWWVDSGRNYIPQLENSFIMRSEHSSALLGYSLPDLPIRPTRDNFNELIININDNMISATWTDTHLSFISFLVSLFN